MTVSYGSIIATVKYGSFFRLLFRWRGSLYKLVWPGLLVYCFFYAAVAVAYHSIPDKPEYRSAKLLFVRVCYYAGRVTDAVPLSFVLAFYVNLVVGRWWQQFLCLPTPDAICLLLSAYIGENSESNDSKLAVSDDERSLVYRRTITRYVNLASALCFCSISVCMKQRFPTLDSLVMCGLMTEQEMEIYSRLDDSTNSFFVPLVWAISLITKAREEKMIREDRHVDAIVNQVVNFWEKLNKLCLYDWVNVPLVYNQVVALAVYIYFGVTIFGHQFVDASLIIKAANLKVNKSSLSPANNSIVGNPINIFGNLSDFVKASTDENTDDIPFPQFYSNIPLFTILSFIFYNGWLKVAESLVSPFGMDDDDFEVIPLLERNLNASLFFVDAGVSDPSLIPDLVRTVCRVDVEDYDNYGTDGDNLSRSTTPGGHRTRPKGPPSTFGSVVDNDMPYPPLPPSRERRPSHTAFIGSLAVMAATPKESDLKTARSISPYPESDQESAQFSPDTLFASVESSIHHLGTKLKKFSFVRPNTSAIHGVISRTPRSVNPTKTESVASIRSELNSHNI
ncbi:unnamed protein product [Heterobilharzia americana]|nr:unnamed protein product [Heterobilharzia americana]